MKNDSGRYVIAAGGTGGHIFPGIALAREIVQRRPKASVVFVGTGNEMESRRFAEASFAVESVPASGFAGKGAAARLASLLRLPAGILHARRLLRRLRPRAVAGLGGYVSVPVILAARSLSIPTLIHESNARPGIANRLLARVATRTAVGFEAANRSLPRPGTVTGNPVRPEFFAVPDSGARMGPGRLLAFGGSQGSSVLNNALVEAAPGLAAAGLEVVHQTGERWLEGVRAAYGSVPDRVRLEPFLPRLHEELAWCDLAVCRAGAMTLAELAAAGRPAVLVPLAASTHGHQAENARAFAEAGAGVILEEKDLSGARLAETVTGSMADPDRLKRMSTAARRLGRPDAAARLADLLFEIERSEP